MPMEKMWVEWDDGAHFTQSHKRPGQYSALTRDDDNKTGQVTVSEIEDDDEPSPRSSSDDFDSFDDDDRESQRPEELSPAAQAVVDFASEVAAAVLIHLIDRAIDAAKPKVRRWWVDQALPAIRSMVAAARDTATKRRENDAPADHSGSVATGEIVDLAEGLDSPISGETSAVVATPLGDRPTMSRNEAYQRLCAAVAARAFADDQLKQLLRSQIDESGVYLGAEGWIEKFSATELADSVKVLEANPTLVDDVLALLARQAANSPVALPSAREAPKALRA